MTYFVVTISLLAFLLAMGVLSVLLATEHEPDGSDRRERRIATILAVSLFGISIWGAAIMAPGIS